MVTDGKNLQVVPGENSLELFKSTDIKFCAFLRYLKFSLHSWEKIRGKNLLFTIAISKEDLRRLEHAFNNELSEAQVDAHGVMYEYERLRGLRYQS
jgi:hypothetical protein